MPPPDELRERFGINLRQGRKELGVSQEELAFRADVAPSAVGLFELGKKTPRIDTFIRLAGAVERKPSELTAGILWMPAEVVGTPGSFDVPEDPELEAEVAELRGGARKFRGKRAKR
ncbi:MAG TPA: helix-turn-helix transcriptional regulator [Solirubrobacterales bacterium]|nr:helix-turn-helix transcriptional regulator [Solirubrobacterales bacterium]